MRLNVGYLRGCPCKNRPLDFRPKIEFLQIFCVRQLVHMINKVKVKCDHRSKFSNLSNWKEEA